MFARSGCAGHCCQHAPAEHFGFLAGQRQWCGIGGKLCFEAGHARAEDALQLVDLGTDDGGERLGCYLIEILGASQFCSQHFDAGGR